MNTMAVTMTHVTDGEEEEDDITYVAYKQHFFTSILLNRYSF